MKMTMWKIQHEKDCDCYSIRARTKKEAIAIYTETMGEGHHRPSDFADVVEKLVYSFKDSLDLADSIMSENSGDWDVIERREYSL